MRRYLTDGVDHRVKHIKAFALVLDNRIVLTVCTQADAVSQFGHCIDVVHPLAVYVLEQYNALQLTHDRRAEGLLLGFVDLVRLIGQNVGQLVSGQVIALLGREGAVLRTEEYADERTARWFNLQVEIRLCSPMAACTAWAMVSSIILTMLSLTSLPSSTCRRCA